MLHRLIMSCVFAGLALSAGTVRSDIVTFHFGGTLVNVDSPLSSAFSVGDSFTGSLSFEASSTINPDTFTTSSQLGIYRVPPAFTVNINGLVYSDLGGSGSGSVLATSGSKCVTSSAATTREPVSSATMIS